MIERHDVTEEVEVPVGGNVTLKCKTSGQPRPEITWLHNGHILNRSHIRARRHLQVEYFGELTMSDDGSASLSLSNITESNKGLYTVLAANKAGIVEKNFEVKVLGKSFLIDFESKLTELLQDFQTSNTPFIFPLIFSPM